jgi:hypothetical protein
MADQVFEGDDPEVTGFYGVPPATEFSQAATGSASVVVTSGVQHVPTEWPESDSPAANTGVHGDTPGLNNE